MHPFNRAAFIALGLTLAVPTVALADTYTIENFTGGIFGGNANVSSPFAGNGFVQGMSFSGSFLQDDNQVPAGGSGFVNVFTDFYPDAAVIPAATMFTFNMGPLTFTAADNNDADFFGGPYVQYNNGQFNGFALEANFTFLANPYQLLIQGGSLSVHALQNGFATGPSLINGYINVGNGALPGGGAYTPPPPDCHRTNSCGPGPGVPEPATWAMMVIGFGAAGGLLRRRRSVSAAT